MTPEQRTALYAFAATIGTIASFYGITTEQEVALWLGALTNALAVVTAFLHRPTKAE